MGEGAHVSDVTQIMALSTLGKNRRIAESDKLASFTKHPDTFFPGFFGYFAGVIHVGKNYRCVLSQIMGGAGVMRHLGNRDVSKDTVLPHLLYEGVWTSDVLLVVGGSDMSELCPYPISGCYNGPNLEVFQEDVLELDYLFMGDSSCRSEVEVSISLPVALLVEFRDPPAADQNNGVFGELFDLRASCQDKEGRGESSDSFFFPPVFGSAVMNYGDNSLVGGRLIRRVSLGTSLGSMILCLSDLCRLVSNLLASCCGGIVEVDYSSTVVRLRLDLNPFRGFGLCSRGRH
jgi:hypothetical protein